MGRHFEGYVQDHSENLKADITLMKIIFGWDDVKKMRMRPAEEVVLGEKVEN